MSACDWPTDPTCFPDEWESLDPDLKQRSISLASKTLQRLTGGRVSNCPVTIRPCAPRCGCGLAYQPYGDPTFTPLNMGGVWTNACGHVDCGCTVLCEVILPAPVGRVDEVKIDGAVLPGTDYRVDGNRLVYTGAFDCPFPATQNLALDDTEDDTFSVTYLNAHEVDENGAYAVAVLAYEYAKACAGNSCRLPTGVTSIARQGITMEIASGAFPGGLTGIREVDAFIMLWNPGALSHGAKVWAPGSVRHRVTP